MSENIDWSVKVGLATAVGAVVSGGAVTAEEDSGYMIEEITVTANKQGSVSVQDLATSVQAIGEEDLKRAQLFSVEDYSRFIPSMSYMGNSSGAGKIFFRGVADAPDTFIAGSSAAVYLDEQPLTQSAQVDVRLIDVDRVEALSGPQGTLFGSSSQSGTLRIVTNKPDTNQFEAFVDVTGSGTSEGDPSYDISGMVNIPVNEDLAIRLVGFSAKQGGFIDNVLGQTPASENGGRTSINGVQLNDGTVGGVQVFDSVVEDDWNETTINGGRIAAKWDVTDNLTMTAQVAFQDVDSDAESTFDDTQGDLETVQFFPDVRKDEWTQYSFTVEADLGWANLVSATAYFTRDSFYQNDTTSYSAYFGSFCYYATASYNIYCFQPAGVNYTYLDPIGFLTNDQKNTSISQEFRLSSQGERVDWVAGVFYERREEEWDFNTYITNDGGYRNSQGFANWGANYWNVNPLTPSDAWWFSADDTEWDTLAAFGEVTMRWTDKFSTTLGARWFDIEMDKTYFVELPKGRLTPTATGKHGCLVSQGPCNSSDSTDSSDTGITSPTSSEDDIAIKVALQYNIDDDKMIYGLYSEGFRPGGTNRNRGNPFYPVQFESDFLDNYEVGLRSMWGDGRLMLNATYFSMQWDDYQLEVVDPSNLACGNPEAPPAPFCGQPWQKVITNVGSASIDGFEVHFQWMASERLEIGGNASWLEAEVDEDVPELAGVTDGTALPFAPDLKGSLYAQYTWPVSFAGATEAYVRLQTSYTDDTVNQVQVIGGNTPQLTQDSYSVTDFKAGLVADGWEISMFVKNLDDERGQVFQDNTDFEPFWGRNRVSVVRPREAGLRFVKYFN